MTDADDIRFEQRLSKVGGPAAVIAALREVLDAHANGDLVTCSIPSVDVYLTARGIDALSKGWEIIQTLEGTT